MILSLSLLTIASGSAAQLIEIGDGRIDGRKVLAYDHSWSQCNLKDGQWVAGPKLRERATIVGDTILRIEQESTLPGEVASHARFYFDRASLAPIRFEREFLAPGGQALATRAFDFDADGYRAEIHQKGETRTKTGKLSAEMFSAATMGIPLSTLQFDEQPVAFTALMTNFDASYAILAKKAGQEMLQTGDGQVAVNWIDVEWKHNEIGDIYAPGPDASGGRYWITESAIPGLPRVIRYKTDSYVVEYEQKYCPASNQGAAAE